MIYVIVARELKVMKVGVSRNPRSRIRSLQTAVPVPLEVIAVIPSGDRAVEARFHEVLHEFRMKGEWFRLTIPAMNRCASLFRDYPDALDGPSYDAVLAGNASLISGITLDSLRET